MPRLVVGHIQENELLEISVQVEYLNAAVAAIGGVEVAVAIDSDVVRIPEMTGIFIGVDSARSGSSPMLDPVPVFVELRDARIEITVAHVNIVVFVPGDVG